MSHEVIVMHTAYTAGGMRLPGICRPSVGRGRARENGARAAREGDRVPEDACGRSCTPVADCRYPFSVLIDYDPWALPERVRKNLTTCARTFLRRCGKRMSRYGDAVPEEERES